MHERFFEEQSSRLIKCDFEFKPGRRVYKLYLLTLARNAKEPEFNNESVMKYLSLWQRASEMVNKENFHLLNIVIALNK